MASVLQLKPALSVKRGGDSDHRLLLTEAIRQYLNSVKQRNLSRSTQFLYSTYLTRWQHWLADERQSFYLDQVDRENLLAWAAACADRWAPRTCKGAYTAVRVFLKWAKEQGMTQDNAFEVLKSPKITRQLQRTAMPDEVVKLLAACEKPVHGGLSEAEAYAAAKRNAALVCLMFDSLLRASEICRLRIQDVNLEKHSGTVVTKGGDQEVFRFGKETARRLAAWLKVREAAPGVDNFFVGITGNTPGQPLTRSGLRLIIGRLADRAGVDHLSPHAFRRGGACQALEMGAPAKVLQVMGRWQDGRSAAELIDLYTLAYSGETAYDKYSPADGALTDGDGAAAGQAPGTRP